MTTVPITLEAFLLPFADHFRAQGWRVDALANGATTNPHLDGHFDARFDVAWSRNPLSPSNLLGTASKVREIVVAGGYDIIHVHTPIAAFVTRYALSELRKHPNGPTIVYTCHGFHFYRGQAALPKTLFRSMERTAAPWTDYLVTVNHEDFDAAREFPGLPPERVRLIPGIGVDTDRFAPRAAGDRDSARVRDELLATAKSRTANPFVITMVAEFGAVKRHHLALDAFARVQDPRTRLILVGDGPLQPDARARAARLRIDDRVGFAGYRRDIPDVLAASDALMLTSEREGLNRSALEAMASGKPVICTDTRGITDAIGTDACGWIVGHSDVPALASAIDAAASDPADLARRGAAARERAVAEFALPRIIDAYERLYGEALASRL